MLQLINLRQHQHHAWNAIFQREKISTAFATHEASTFYIHAQGCQCPKQPWHDLPLFFPLLLFNGVRGIISGIKDARRWVLKHFRQTSLETKSLRRLTSFFVPPPSEDFRDAFLRRQRCGVPLDAPVHITNDADEPAHLVAHQRMQHTIVIRPTTVRAISTDIIRQTIVQHYWLGTRCHLPY